MEHCPPHFTPVTFDLYAQEKVITDWIWTNLSGRFYFGDVYVNDSTQRGLTINKLASFELHGEASYFSLILDTINKNNLEIW